MKNIIIIVAVILLVAGFAGCKKDDNNNQTPGQQALEYKGNAQVVIRYYDYNPATGQDYFVEEKHYNYNALVFTNPPMQQDGFTETNPFNLMISPDRNQSVDEEGHVDISSALRFAVSTGYVVLQYWNYTLNGNQISGTLTDNHTAEAAAANLLWAWEDVAGTIMAWPFPIANGATITGTVTTTSVSLTITGQSVDTYREFNCQINAAVK